jgi:hypothetical protein
MKQNAGEYCQARNQTNENPKLEKPMHGVPPFRRSTAKPSSIAAEYAVPQFARFDFAEERSVPRGTGLDPSRSSVVSQKKQR